MQNLILISAAFAASATASLLPRQGSSQQDPSDYLDYVCMPTNSSGYPDFNAPCIAVQAITAECIYGAAGLSVIMASGSDNGAEIDEDTPMLSNSTQRNCVCQSQFFNALSGCNNCYKAHGAPSGLDGYVDQSFIASASSSYCAVTNTPTAGLADVLYGYATGSVASSLQSVASTASQTSTFSDPLGNNTAVSAYFTPSVTGSAFWVVAQATQTASNSTGSSSGSVSGQIVATSAPASSAAGTSSRVSGSASGASASASTTAGSGAGKQELAAVVGALALMAGVVAL
ncbi:hypothetical protein BAUCODRAFT_67483 [Baudoinia panamericana UAMH 10762]|uniref:Uncharacterized protein n=1 Tax=Baudoinia panamericana (strain UAMH 10762) TaxID=717646 RepID=M2LTU7_BAUPA|nr:uncharacterized protein BAUCODRAFT_67483 [Baudoinia panamericana UAMH 10762]EMC97957.1 hypothetical protein BAUCODRAFT_67483 [Baudoinia panamericana UAMH 10762]